MHLGTTLNIMDTMLDIVLTDAEKDFLEISQILNPEGSPPVIDFLGSFALCKSCSYCYKVGILLCKTEANISQKDSELATIQKEHKLLMEKLKMMKKDLRKKKNMAASLSNTGDILTKEVQKLKRQEGAMRSKFSKNVSSSYQST